MEAGSLALSDDQPSNPDFEALIDLLATDDDGFEQGDLPRAADLRRPNGHFDYQKVRKYFEHSNRAASPTGQRDMRPGNSQLAQSDQQESPKTTDEPNVEPALVDIFNQEIYDSSQDDRHVEPRKTDQPPPPVFTSASPLQSPHATDDATQELLMKSISPLVLPASRMSTNVSPHLAGHSSAPHTSISRSHSEQLPQFLHGVDALSIRPPSPRNHRTPDSHSRTQSDNSGSPANETPPYLPPRPPSRLGNFPFDRSPSSQAPPTRDLSTDRGRTGTPGNYDIEDTQSHHEESDLLRALKETLLESRRQTDALNEALNLARRETAELQDRCNELKSLAEELRIPHDQTTRSLPQSHVTLRPLTSDNAQTPMQEGMDSTFDESLVTESLSSSTPRQAESPPMDVMELMGEYELRENFRALLTALSLPYNVPELHQTISLMSSLPQLRSSTTASPKSVSDIIRALEFVRFVDELVWKRSNPKYARRAAGEDLGIFSEDNIRGLEDRVELWERAVRSSKRK